MGLHQHSKAGRRAWFGRCGGLALLGGSVAGCKAPLEPSSSANDPRAWTDERAAMRWMREEEKLARDVYLELGARWPEIHQFQNIASSEQRHMDAMRSLLAAAHEQDPVEDESVGVFEQPELAELYAALVDAGRTSALAALEVGAEIEEIDIADLDRALALTDDPRAKTIYGQLRYGSCNHLQAFTRGLSRRGHEYTPKHLDEQTFAAALAQAHGGRGHGPGHGQGHGQGRR